MEVEAKFDCLEPADSREFYRKVFTAGGVTCRPQVADTGVLTLSVVSPRLVMAFRKVDGVAGHLRIFELVVRMPDPEKALAVLGEAWHAPKEGEKILLSDHEGNRVVLIKDALPSVSIVATKP